MEHEARMQGPNGMTALMIAALHHTKNAYDVLQAVEGGI